MTSREPYVAVLAHEPFAASTVLFFGALVEGMPAAVRVISPRQRGAAVIVGGATAVIFVRALFDYGACGFTARWLNLPRYYFLDDNFVLLREEGLGGGFLRRYTEENVKRVLRGFRGVLLSSPALATDFVRRRLFDAPRQFPPIALPACPPPLRQNTGGIRVAFFGGRHLHRVFAALLVPALTKLAAERPVTLIAVGIETDIPRAPGLTVMNVPYQDSYLDGVRRMRELGVDVLVHPSASGMTNNAFKIPHALITANALGAVPIVSAGAPYDAVDRDILLRCADTAEAWYAALVVAAEEVFAAALLPRLSGYCRSHFDGGGNRQVIRDILARHRTPSDAAAAVLARRAVAASAVFYEAGDRLSGRILRGRWWPDW